MNKIQHRIFVDHLIHLRRHSKISVCSFKLIPFVYGILPGSGLNYALLTAQLAPALTKSYQQKMREWQTFQKSQFLGRYPLLLILSFNCSSSIVNYRRQSITPKSDLNNNPSKNPDEHPIISSPPIIDTSSSSSMIDQSKIERKFSPLTPILSPNQRTLIVHQWRQIMSEEISLRYYNDYLQKKMLLLKELETNLKDLKTKIFCCTNQIMKSQSMTDLNRPRSSSRRCQSLESAIFMPASWSLAVQSGAYSDVLDGTSNATTERTFLFNKTFFDQLEQFKDNREKFDEDFLEDLQLMNSAK